MWKVLVEALDNEEQTVRSFVHAKAREFLSSVAPLLGNLVLIWEKILVVQDLNKLWNQICYHNNFYEWLADILCLLKSKD